MIAAVIISCALGILGIKSITESMLYAQPFALRAVKNSAAFLADVFVLLLSLPVCGIVKSSISRSSRGKRMNGSTYEGV